MIKCSGAAHLQTLQGVITVCSVYLIKIGTRTFYLGIGAEGELAQALQLHDVHLGAQVLGQVTVDAEGNLAVMTLEGAGIVSAGCPKRHVHVHLKGERMPCMNTHTQV